ncbi:MAG: hypothetical protein ACFFB2_06030 [Promethearchaeota archaeon]
MKELRIGITLFLLLVSIFAFSTQNSLYFLPFTNRDSLSSSSGTERINPLQNNFPPPTSTIHTGIIPPSSFSSRNSISDIEDPLPQYFPGSNIHIRNQFTLAQYNATHNIVIVCQIIYIFLFESSTDLQTMINEGNSSDPTTSPYYVHEAITNGSHALGWPAIVPDLILNPTVGFIDTIFQIPDSSTLANMGITSDDEVTIFQYYPAHNETSRINIPISRTDNFTLSSVATFSVDAPGIINPNSGDNTFRQGEFATATLSAMSGTTPIDNVSVSCKLYFANDSEVTDSGFFYELREVSFPYSPSTITDLNGDLGLFLNTTYPDSPEGDYYINLTADFTGTPFYLMNSEKVITIKASFTVENEPDIVADNLFTISNVQPDPMDPPNANNTIVTIQIQAYDAYGTGAYPLANIPVNATLDIQEVWVDINFGAAFTPNGTGWALTDLNGEITFDITAGFPIPYELKTPIITVQADLQSNLAPIYPPGEPHRFVENSTGGKIVTEIRVISIDPDFWVGAIYRISSPVSIRPGQSTELEYEVSNAGGPTQNVPVKITSQEFIPGVTLFINETIYPRYDIYDYYYTDSNGRIKVTVYTTYLTTPEYVKNIALNITADFENDTEPRWIGSTNAIIAFSATNIYANFERTWTSDIRTDDLTINPNFNNCTISYLATNESDTIIRPGDDIAVTFQVREEGGTRLSNVYVNISLSGSYPGVSLAIHPSSGAQDPLRADYYYTNASGMITVIIGTIYGTTPKTLDIILDATADFENDSYSVWYVGSKGLRPDFRSNSSYSEGVGSITVAPQYFIGEISVKGNPKTIVPQNGTLIIDFELRLRDYNTGTRITPPAILIDGVNISILINNQAPSDLNMEVTPTWKYSEDSIVTFIIKTNNTSGIAPEGDYVINAEADYGAAQSLIYNFTYNTVPTGHLSGIWVNASDSDGYSRTSQSFKVQNRDIITVLISEVTDLFHPDAGFNSNDGLYEIYRGSTNINITGTYEDATQDPVPVDNIQILMNHSKGFEILASSVSVTDGIFSVIVNLPPTTPLEDGIEIYGYDPTPPIPPEVRVGYNATRVVTTVDLSHAISGFNGDSVFPGESLSIQGRLTDNLGNFIDSSIPMFQDSFSELTGRLRLVGWTGTDEVGVPFETTPNPDGSFDLSYQIPYNYTDDILFIRLNITSLGLIHYRTNYIQTTSINVYHDFQIENLEIYFPGNDSSTGLTNNSIYIVSGINNRDITIRGTLVDSIGRNLIEKQIRTTWNGSPALGSVNAVGYFSRDYSFSGWENNSWIWQFHHILDNGTILSSFYIITLHWEVYDETEPSITIVEPIANSSEGVVLLRQNDTTMIIVTVRDPDYNVVSVGLDPTTVMIIINGTSDTMVSSDNTTFSYMWDTSDPVDGFYIITIQVSDLANNTNQTEIMIVFDVKLPTGTIEALANSEGYLIIDHETGNAVISGKIEDKSSITGWNFGIDNVSARFYILNTQRGILMVNSSIFISENSYSYDWGIIFNPDDFEQLERNGSFVGYEEWTLRITFSDLAGNSNQTEIIVKLDNTQPSLSIKDELPDNIEKNLVLNITYEDQHSGIYIESLSIQLLNSTKAFVNGYTFYSGDNNFIAVSESEATIDFDLSGLKKGKYFVRVVIFDNTGNKKEIISDSFNFTPPSPPSNPLINIILVVLSPILAFGGGVGIAALYERIKGIRSA